MVGSPGQSKAALQAGSFFSYIPRHPAGPSWLPFSFGQGGKSLERHISHRLNGLLSRSLAFDAPDVASGEQQTGDGQSQTIRCEGAGFLVKYQAREIAGGQLFSVKPAVFQTKHDVCVFYGYLSNLEDCLENFTKRRNVKGLGSAPVGSSQDGVLAAELLLHMYNSTRSSDLLIMLSELQGVYSFVIYDSHRKGVFAARDPSGREPLYYAVDDDEGLSFTNKPFDVPGGEQKSEWAQVPPGHFIAGKNDTKLQQFALTPAQLYEREVYESMDGGDSSPPPPGSPLGGGAEAISLSSVQSHFDVDSLFRISM